MKVINYKKRLLFSLKEKTSGLLVVAPEELILVDERKDTKLLEQTTITISRTALATDNGRLIKIKGNATYTIDQSTLPTGWNVIVRSFTGATCTFVASAGTTFNAPTGLILKPLKMCSIIKDSDDNKILINGETSLT